jgi:hypothetical protein
MLYRWRWPLLFTIAVLLLSRTAGFAGTGVFPWPADRPSPLPQLAKKRVIDKSCIMMCDQWGEHDCLKWVMRCKGDPGYPKGLSIAQ